MALPLLAIAAALGLAKAGTDMYSGVRADRAGRRIANRQNANAETQRHDARRAAIMNDLGIDAPIKEHQLLDLGRGTNQTNERILSGLLGMGSNIAALGAANQAPSGPTNVPMPYQQKVFESKYGPGSLIKPGTPYR